MSSDMAQYQDLFVQTAKEYLSTLNNELLRLEKTPDDHEAIEAIFRAMHSLKGQSAAMGYQQTGYLCHVIEDVFYQLKEGHWAIDSNLADLLFKALDALSGSVAHIELDGTELPTSVITDQIKQVSGVQTTGSGHSDHDEALPTVTNPAEAAAQAPDTVAEHPPAAETLPTVMYSGHIEIKTIPIKVEQLDDIVGSLEELMVNRLTMQTLLHTVDNSALSQVQDKTNVLIDLLQFQIMKLRTVPLSLILDHFPRMSRDLGRMLGKQIELRIEGSDLELDRAIVERLDDPLTHLIRNAADHGIGESGVITIQAHIERDYAVVSVSDNGRGIDWRAIAKKAQISLDDQAALKKVMFSGVSTATEVSLISGRGVGLDAVKQSVSEMGGTIDVITAPDKGTTFTLRLPLTLSVVRALIVRVGYQRYAIAASAVERSLRFRDHEIVKSVGQEVFRYEDQELPLIRMQYLFEPAIDKKYAPTSPYAVVLSVDDERLAIAVDDISETLETVIRPLPRLLRGSRMFSGVAVIGDGTNVLLINPGGIAHE